ncbi:hypothetical protein CEXT_607971 [Caerostris extrusa]|uniref:Uncharacterized protein n=1 Tax=Caerostris extrusa TaxID=172846 RepID=A0AAV4XN01_CAEEX|nr:hypothetical protein CEXT_607971 [Caerostris extrusa]
MVYDVVFLFLRVCRIIADLQLQAMAEMGVDNARFCGNSGGYKRYNWSKKNGNRRKKSMDPFEEAQDSVDGKHSSYKIPKVTKAAARIFKCIYAVSMPKQGNRGQLRDETPQQPSS